MTTTATPQTRMRSTLLQAGIPSKEVKVYGSQVMVTAWSEDAAERWAELLRAFCAKVRRPHATVDYNKENRNTVLRPTTHRVWRVWGTV